MKTLARAAAAAILLVALAAGGAHAQQTPYTNPSTPTNPPSDTPRGNTSEQCIPDDDSVDSDGPGGTDDEVLCDTNDSDVLPDESETGSETPPDEGGETVVVPGGAEQPRGTTASGPTAPSGSLPFTGGDVVGLTVVGAAALAVGALLVRRSRAMKQSA